MCAGVETPFPGSFRVAMFDIAIHARYAPVRRWPRDWMGLPSRLINADGFARHLAGRLRDWTLRLPSFGPSTPTDASQVKSSPVSDCELSLSVRVSSSFPDLDPFSRGIGHLADALRYSLPCIPTSVSRRRCTAVHGRHALSGGATGPRAPDAREERPSRGLEPAGRRQTPLAWAMNTGGRAVGCRAEADRRGEQPCGLRWAHRRTGEVECSPSRRCMWPAPPTMTKRATSGKI